MCGLLRFISTFQLIVNMKTLIKPSMMETPYNFQLSFTDIKYLQNAMSESNKQQSNARVKLTQSHKTCRQQNRQYQHHCPLSHDFLVKRAQIL